MRARLVNEAKTNAAMGEAALPRATNITLGQAWEHYLRDWLEANGKTTGPDLSLIRGHLKPLCALPLQQITAHRLDQLMGEMRAAGKSAQTIRHAVGLVRRVMRRMRMWQLYRGPMLFEEV